MYAERAASCVSLPESVAESSTKVAASAPEVTDGTAARAAVALPAAPAEALVSGDVDPPNQTGAPRPGVESRALSSTGSADAAAPANGCEPASVCGGGTPPTSNNPATVAAEPVASHAGASATSPASTPAFAGNAGGGESCRDASAPEGARGSAVSAALLAPESPGREGDAESEQLDEQPQHQPEQQPQQQPEPQPEPRSGPQPVLQPAQQPGPQPELEEQPKQGEAQPAGSAPASPTPARSPAESPPVRPARPRDEALAQSAATRAAALREEAGGIASLKASMSDMRSKVARLELALERALRAKAAADAQLQAAEAQQQEAAAFAEARLADRAREAELLRAKLRLLQCGSSGDAGSGGAAGGGGLEDADAALIAAYQSENEAAMQRVKELEQQLAQARAAVASEAGRLERQFAAAQELQRRESGEAAERLKRLLAAQAELQAVQEASAVREAELRSDITRLKGERRVLEARLGGVDLARCEAEDALVASVRAEMAAMASAHAQRVAALETRLAWFAENQRLLGDGDALIAEQADTIRALQQRLAALESPAGVRQRQRIKELEGELEALQQAFASRHPNTLPAVLSSARPPPCEGRLAAELRSEVESLRARLASEASAHENALRALQQQYEKLKIGMEQRRAREQAETLAARGGRGRAQALERRLSDLHAQYARRIKTLEARAVAAEAAAASATAAGPCPDDIEPPRDGDGRGGSGEATAAAGRKSGGNAALAEQAQREELLQQLAQRDATVSELQQRLRAAERTVRQQQRQAAATAVVASHRSTPAAAAAAQDPAAAAAAAAQQAEQQQLREELATARHALELLQSSHSQLIERCAELGTEQQRAALRLREDVAAREAERWMARVERLEQGLHAAEAEIEHLEGALAAAEDAAGPSARAFIALERRLASIADESAAAEARWRTAEADARRAAKAEVARAEERHRAALAERDAVIAAFRGQVDALLGAARALQLQNDTP